MELVSKDGQLGTGQHTAVAALREQIPMDRGKLLGVAVPSSLYVVIDKGHNQRLGLWRRGYRLDSGGGKFLLV